MGVTRAPVAGCLAGLRREWRAFRKRAGAPGSCLAPVSFMMCKGTHLSVPMQDLSLGFGAMGLTRFGAWLVSAGGICRLADDAGDPQAGDCQALTSSASSGLADP